MSTLVKMKSSVRRCPYRRGESRPQVRAKSSLRIDGHKSSWAWEYVGSFPWEALIHRNILIKYIFSAIVIFMNIAVPFLESYLCLFLTENKGFIYPNRIRMWQCGFSFYFSPVCLVRQKIVSRMNWACALSG